MGEEKPSDQRPKSSKFSDQNHPPKTNNGDVKPNGDFTKMKPSWGSNLVKGFSGDRKSKTRAPHSAAQSMKPPFTASEGSNQRSHQPLVSNSRIKRSLITATQVHPQTVQNKPKPFSASSGDVFLEIDHLRNLLQESKDREGKLQAELSERDLESKKSEINGLLKRVRLLETEKANLLSQLSSLSSAMGKQDELLLTEVHGDLGSVAMEVLELRRLNKELQLQKRHLSGRIATMEAQLADLAKVYEIDRIEQIKVEVSSLRSANDDIRKEVECLQLSRMNDVEELAYLRWVNLCLTDELRGCTDALPDRPLSSPASVLDTSESVFIIPYPADDRSTAVKKFKKWTVTDEDSRETKTPERKWEESARRHSISGSNCCPELRPVGFVCSRVAGKGAEALVSDKYGLEVGNRGVSGVEKRVPRIPNPPPRPSCSEFGKKNRGGGAAPPPPPPPPPPTGRSAAGKVRRAPQVVEFYHSLMKRESRKECLGSGAKGAAASGAASVRSSMIGEIENRSSHLLAIKADVETQGEFVNSLIREVNNAVYQTIEDVDAFVKWLDDELGFLVDERAVLKHFDWPEKKADTLREAACGYRDLKKLEREVTNYMDDPRSPCDDALKKMTTFFERMEPTVHDILRTRDMLMRRCKEFDVPTDWVSDVDILSKIKLGSVRLAKMYMKRVAMELQPKEGVAYKDSSLDYMLLGGVRFAFRAHQFAGGFDAETMHVFEELRDLAVFFSKRRG